MLRKIIAESARNPLLVEPPLFTPDTILPRLFGGDRVATRLFGGQ